MERGLELLKEATRRYCGSGGGSSGGTSPALADMSAPASFRQAKGERPPAPRRPESAERRAHELAVLEALAAADVAKKARTASSSPRPPAEGGDESPGSVAAARRLRDRRREEAAKKRRLADDVDLVLAQRFAFESGAKAAARMRDALSLQKKPSKSVRVPSASATTRSQGNVRNQIATDTSTYGELLID
jgi:hypothetical protein